MAYIEREALMKYADTQPGRLISNKSIQFFPAADVAPVRHGKWINYGNGVCCSVCESERPTKANDHKLSVKEVNFCYYCGAKMDLED